MQDVQPQKARRRVLIVDDDAEVQKRAFESLNCSGFDCVPVSDGDQSMECLTDVDLDAAVETALDKTGSFREGKLLPSLAWASHFEGEFKFSSD